MPSWASPRRAAAAAWRAGQSVTFPLPDLRSAQTTNRGPAAGPQRGPTGRGTVPDITGPDGDRAGLHIVEMRAEHGAISRRQFGPTGHAHDDDLIGEDRRLLRLVGQRVYAAQPDERPHQVRAAIATQPRRPRSRPFLFDSSGTRPPTG